MKTAAFLLLLLALVAGACGVWLSSGETDGQRQHYQKVKAYVSQVEKEGFSQQSFKGFAGDVHAVRKSFALYGALPRSLHVVSLALLAIAAGLVLFIRSEK